MAALANQVHSTAQQIGARIGWNPIDAATPGRWNDYGLAGVANGDAAEGYGLCYVNLLGIGSRAKQDVGAGWDRSDRGLNGGKMY